jgi:hypothetical protein
MIDNEPLAFKPVGEVEYIYNGFRIRNTVVERDGQFFLEANEEDMYWAQNFTIEVTDEAETT